MTTRVVIAGGPKTGKSSLAECLEAIDVARIRHTDDLAHLGWSEASAAAALWFGAPGPWIVEGVAAARALRKWLASHPEGKPCDVVYVLDEPVVARTPGQETMAKGCQTVFAEVRPELVRRGVEIRVGPV